MTQITGLMGDCLELMKDIPDKSVDMILCDLPYGTTKCKWDSVIPMNNYIEINIKNKLKQLNKDEYLKYCIQTFGFNDISKEQYALFNVKCKKGLWSHYNRIIKDNGAICLFGQAPFDKVLGCSNPSQLRYEWIWEKTSATGHLNAKKMPMKAHESILVFYKKLPIYNPQKTQGHAPMHSYTKSVETQNNTELYGYMGKEISGGGETDRYPRSVIVFPSDKQTSCLHPTQKPVALLEYLIKTYTNEGMTVLDSCMGSGSTGVACITTKRNFIGIELSEDYFSMAKKRLEETQHYFYESKFVWR